MLAGINKVVILKKGTQEKEEKGTAEIKVHEQY